jgi:hypothetical protein
MAMMDDDGKLNVDYEEYLNGKAMDDATLAKVRRRIRR